MSGLRYSHLWVGTRCLAVVLAVSEAHAQEVLSHWPSLRVEGVPNSSPGVWSPSASLSVTTTRIQSSRSKCRGTVECCTTCQTADCNHVVDAGKKYLFSTFMCTF